ncbi:MAG: nucleotidyltransferase domain-containing protein [Bacteroidales bacterium]|nr:nucleotidyltransferase domain-containing protein [Bacteroidales bacterium]
MRLDKPDIASRDQIIELLRTFKNENAERYGIESMALFGSVARGEHNENSDVDLLIKFKSPSLYLYSELSDALESILGRKVDIVSESARKRPWFAEEISKDLIYL